jgi:hypothetical protein
MSADRSGGARHGTVHSWFDPFAAHSSDAVAVEIGD